MPKLACVPILARTVYEKMLAVPQRHLLMPQGAVFPTSAIAACVIFTDPPKSCVCSGILLRNRSPVRKLMPKFACLAIATTIKEITAQRRLTKRLQRAGLVTGSTRLLLRPCVGQILLVFLESRTYFVQPI